jgi:hypothetical protein
VFRPAAPRDTGKQSNCRHFVFLWLGTTAEADVEEDKGLFVCLYKKEFDNTNTSLCYFPYKGRK